MTQTPDFLHPQFLSFLGVFTPEKFPIQAPQSNLGLEIQIKAWKKKGGDIEFNLSLETPAAGELETPKFCFFPPFFTSPKRCEFWGFFGGARGTSAEKGALPAPAQPPQKYQRSPISPAQPNPQKNPQIAFPAQKKFR